MLTLTVPPEWVTKPQDEEVVEGQDVTFPCKVSGVPQPTVVWRKLAGMTFVIYFLGSSCLDKIVLVANHIHFDLNCFSDGGNVVADGSSHNHHSLVGQHSSHVPGTKYLFVLELNHRRPVFGAGGRFRLLANGTLMIRNVGEADEGNYLCEAENGVNEPLGKVVKLKVNGKFILNYEFEICCTQTYISRTNIQSCIFKHFIILHYLRYHQI